MESIEKPCYRKLSRDGPKGHDREVTTPIVFGSQRLHMDQHLTKEQLEQSVENLRREIASLRFLERSHKKDQEELRAIELQLSGIIHSAMDAIITVDESQHVILFNFTAEQMFQCSGQDAMGRSIDQFIPERFRENHKNHIKVFGETKTTNRKNGSPGINHRGAGLTVRNFPLKHLFLKRRSMEESCLRLSSGISANDPVSNKHSRPARSDSRPL